jgi:hypothetical protein
MSDTTSTTNNVAELVAKQAELKALRKAVKEQADLAAWEDKTAARNPAFVRGSVRKATEAEAEIVGHSHGKVCEIVCQACGETRIVNTQDAFQAKYCLECRDAAKKQANREKRAVKKMAETSVEDLQAQIAELNELLAKKAA